MSNEQNYSEYEPWEQSTYRTGSTRPPKSHGGLIAVLLVLVIALCGIVSVLSIANIRLTQRVNASETGDDLPIVYSNGPDESTGLTDATSATEDDRHPGDTVVALQPTKQSEENIPQQGGLSLQSIYEKAIDSVVSISCSYPSGSSTGTGVVLTADGYIVTNCHVVENAQEISVLLTDGRTLDASLIGMDAISDLAVLHITAEELMPAELGDSGVLRVGDSVVAIGDPLGVALRGSMTDGIISAINRDISIEGRTMNLIQTNAALNSGNSGGPLLNCYGQVIGINTMKMGDSMSVAGVEGLGFAIPSTTVRDVVNQLIDQGYVSGRPSLGITGESVSTLYQFYYGLPSGLYITGVEAGSSAAEAGITPDDILLSVDGVRIYDSDGLKTQLYTYEPGDTVRVVIYRDRKQYTLTLTVGEANG